MAKAKQSYLYNGPVTPLDVEGQSTKMLYPGRSYSALPTDSDIVKNLIESKLLVAEDGGATPITNEGA